MKIEIEVHQQKDQLELNLGKKILQDQKNLVLVEKIKKNQISKLNKSSNQK